MDKKIRSGLYTEAFRRAMVVRDQPRIFVDLLSRSLGHNGSRLKKWADGFASDSDLKRRIDEIIEGGCSDEWIFLFDATGRNEVGAESSDSGNANSRTVPDDVSTVCSDGSSQEVPLEDPVQLIGEKVNDQLQSIRHTIVAAVVSEGRKMIVISGSPMSGKSTLMKSLKMKLETEDRIPVGEYRHLVSSRQVGSGSTPLVIYLDDADIENITSNTESELIKFYRSRSQVLIFVCRNRSKLQGVMDACDAKTFKIPEYSDKEAVEILSSLNTKNYNVSSGTCREIVSLLNAFGVRDKVMNGIDTIRMLLYPTLQSNHRRGVVLSEPTEISFDRKDIESAISRSIGLTIRSMSEEVSSELRTSIESKIIGQSDAVDLVMPLVRSISAGLTDPGSPSGVMLFFGPSGVGKTELAKVIANVLYDGVFHKEDMNTYSEKHSVSRFTGSPPGYIGYGELPEIMDFIDTHTRGVLLLDEVEKAHETVMEHIMELLDTGIMKDTKGKSHDARGFLIIMTSNASWNEKKKSRIRVFGEEDEEESEDPREIMRETGTFKDEVLNRIQTVVKFKELDDTVLQDIANLMLNDLEERLTSIGIKMPKRKRKRFLKDIVGAYEKKTGARSMKTYTETVVKTSILGSNLIE